MREFAALQLLAPRNTTAGGVTGAFVDLQGYIGPGHREIKFVLQAGAGTTAGTAGGSIQSASTTAGAGLATVATFTGLTSAGGIETAHGVLNAGHRYVRYRGTVAAASDMNLAVVAAARDMLV